MEKSSPRLDLQPGFLQLDLDLQHLQRLASIAETVKDEALRRCSVETIRACLGHEGYVPILLTRLQFENLCFVIGHVADKAEAARETYLTAIDKSVEAGRCA